MLNTTAARIYETIDVLIPSSSGQSAEHEGTVDAVLFNFVLIPSSSGQSAEPVDAIFFVLAVAS